MIGTSVIGIVAMLHTATAAIDRMPAYEDIGQFRITTYCEECNDPAGRQTSTGQDPYPGSCAGPSWLVGQTVLIDGQEYRCNDICGAGNTIDLWREGDCSESTLYDSEVYLREENNEN